MSATLIKTLEFFLSLGLLVMIHEFGHYFFARVFGVWVEKFYMFFNPWLSIVKWKPGKYVKWFSHGNETWPNGNQASTLSGSLQAVRWEPWKHPSRVKSKHGK